MSMTSREMERLMRFLLVIWWEPATWTPPWRPSQILEGPQRRDGRWSLRRRSFPCTSTVRPARTREGSTWVLSSSSDDFLISPSSPYPGLRGDPEAVRQEWGQHHAGPRAVPPADQPRREAEQGWGQVSDEGALWPRRWRRVYAFHS